MSRRVISLKLIDVSEVLTASIIRTALKMEAVCFSETLVSTYKSTQRYNPVDQQRQVITGFHCSTSKSHSLHVKLPLVLTSCKHEG
jgi:hypothetical protein